MSRPYRNCNCRAPATTGPDGKRQPGKLLGSRCPDLGKKGHGAWFVRFEAPADADGKRRQPRLGPFVTEREAKDALTGTLGDLRDGTHTDDRQTTLGEYLTRWLDKQQLALKRRTWETYADVLDTGARPRPARPAAGAAHPRRTQGDAEVEHASRAA